MLCALVSAYVRYLWYHPSQTRQGHASRHTPITGVTLTGVVTSAPVKNHDFTSF
jgi:hypothetical protein